MLTIVVIVGALAILLGQGIVRNVEIFEGVYMWRAPVRPEDQPFRYRQREETGLIVD